MVSRLVETKYLILCFFFNKNISDLGGDGPVRARELAGVRADRERCPVHCSRRDLQQQAGAVVPRAGAHQEHQDDQNLQLRGEEVLALHHPDQAGLQADHLQRVQVGRDQDNDDLA